MTRSDIIVMLIQHFYRFCEDPIDGTVFDCEVLDALEALREKYGDCS